MEESYTVHRRRKAAAAARKREKTPEPFSRQQFVQVSDGGDDDDDEEKEDRRARMEKMAEDTERMELLEMTTTKRNEQSDVSHERQDLHHEKETFDITNTPSPNTNQKNIFETSSHGETSMDKNSRQENETNAEVPKVLPLVRRNRNERVPYDDDDNDNDNDYSVEKTKSDSSVGDTTKFRNKKQKSSGSREEDCERSPRGKSCKSIKRKINSNSWKIRPAANIIAENIREQRTKLDDSRKIEDVKDLRSREVATKKRTDNSNNSHHSSDTDVGPMITRKNDILSPRKTNCAKEMQSKQIIPLSNDSLIKDLEKAQKNYRFTQERGILDPDNEDTATATTTSTTTTSVVISDEAILRRRKFTSVETVGEGNKQEPAVSRKGYYFFSWLHFSSLHERKDEIKLEDKKDDDVSSKLTAGNCFAILKNMRAEFKAFMTQNPKDLKTIRELRNRCMAELVVILIYCGLGAFVFRFTEGAFETFYKCGVKRVKRDFLDSLWNYSHNLREDDWKSMARKKLMEFEEQLHAAHEAGMHTYSGQRNWSFLNAVIYCLTVITTIGLRYGHISPITNTGRAITIVYAIFGIPMFLIILADFGKLFTRGIKFLWAFVRRLYYTGSCRKVRRTGPVQEVMKGVQLVYDLATFRRPSQMNPEEIEEMQRQQQQQQQQQQPQVQTVLSLDGNIPDTPGTPAMSAFAVDDEFNLPISVAIFILIGYIFIGATLYCAMEGWGFFESFYFVFISMSTIGFGDYVPKNPISMMGSIVYMVFGLALTSMCINVVQVMLSDSFRQASQKIGATIGFEVAEDDGSVKPATIPPVEMADVHTAIRESESDEKIAPRAKQEDVDI